MPIYAIEQRQSLKRPNLLRDLLTSHEVYSRGRKAEATLVWIPAHLGIEGNEQANMLAKFELTSPSVDIVLNLEFCEAKTIYREHFLKKMARTMGQFNNWSVIPTHRTSSGHLGQIQ